jgi:hypothetical protein
MLAAPFCAVKARPRRIAQEARPRHLTAHRRSPAQLPDFFLADQLTSQLQALMDLLYTARRARATRAA